SRQKKIKQSAFQKIGKNSISKKTNENSPNIFPLKRGRIFNRASHDLYTEIKEVIRNIDSGDFKTKISKEKTKHGKKLYSPKDLNKEFEKAFHKNGWHESRYHYYITLNRQLMEKSILMPHKE